MILKDASENVTMSGFGKTKKFQIKASAKAFKILSSTMYSDPIRAIIRELSCNARDSHIAAGNEDASFTVKLPNEIDRSFYVEDYGLGLSNADVLNIYSTYFESTKTESNDYTGALGLGSKTPFSYTKDFIVISRFEGKETVYTAFVDTDGSPAIAPVSVIDTDKCNGLRVELSIDNTRDIYTFVDKARRVLRPFNDCVNVIGVADFSIAKFGEVLAKKKDFSVEPDVGWICYDSLSHMDTGIKIVQGNIEYPVSRDNISVPRWMYNTTVVISVPIGAFEFSASREEIHYSDDTAEMIQGIIDEIDIDSNKEIQTEVEKITSRYDWSLNSNLYQMVYQKGALVTWQGKSISSNDIHNMNRIIDTDEVITGLRYQNKSMYGEWEECYSLLPSIKHFLVVDKPYLATTKAAKIANCALVKIKGDTPEERAERGMAVLKAHGIPSDMITLSSEISNPPKKTRLKSDGILVSTISANMYNNDQPVVVGIQQLLATIVDKDSDKMVIYVPTHKRKAAKVVGKDTYEEDTTAVAVGMTALKNIGITDPYHIIGVPVHYLDRVEDSWLTLAEGVKVLTKNVIKSDEFKDVVKYKTILLDDLPRAEMVSPYHKDAFEKIDGYKDMIAVQQKIRDINRFDHYHGLVRLARYLNKDIKPNKKLDRITEDGVYKKYPMLSLVLSNVYGISSHHKMIAEYIDLVNKNNV